MPKNAIAKTWSLRASGDGLRYSNNAAGQAQYTPPASGSLPNYISTQTIGTWGTIPSSVFTTSGVMETNADKIISAWGGKYVNTVGIYVGATFISGTFLILWGGGHSDYGGNEYYAYGPLESDTRQWYKPRDSTSPAPNDVDQDGSGNPVSRHTGCVPVYVASYNALISVGGNSRYSSAGGVAAVHKLNFGTPNPNTSTPWSNLSNAVDLTPWHCGYDATTNAIITIPQAGSTIGQFDLDTNTWSTSAFKSPPNFGTGNCSAMDTSRRIFGLWSSDGLRFYDARNGTANDYYTPTTTGTAPANGYAGMLYDPVADRFVVWNGNGKQLWYLTPPVSSPYQGGSAWVWTNETPGTGDTPSAQATNGTYGRFNIAMVGSSRIYTLLNAANESIYFYRAA